MAACLLAPTRGQWSSASLFKHGRSISTTPARLSAAPLRPLIGRYIDKVPVDLARVQSGRNVRLRDYETQKALKRFSYDLKLQDGLVMPADGPNFIGMPLGSIYLSCKH